MGRFITPACLESRISELFSDAIDAHDTIWYDETTTLLDAVLMEVAKLYE